MTSVDALRAILLPNNVAASIVLIISASGEYYGSEEAILIVLATFLLVSLVFNLVTLGVIWIRQRRGMHGSYNPLNTIDLGDQVEDEDRPTTIRGMGPKWFLAVTIFDFAATAAFLVMVPISFTVTTGYYWRSHAGAVGTIGGLVALVTHGFFAILAFSSNFSHRYVVKISVERRPRATSFAAGARAKEGSSSSSYQSVSPRPGPSALVTGITRDAIEPRDEEYNPEADGANGEEAADTTAANTDSSASTQIRMDQAEASERDRLIDDQE